MRLLAGFCFCGLMIVSMTGCGTKAEPRRVAVRGSVIVGDKLVPDATVRFLPEHGNAGPVAVTGVNGGLYKFTKLNGPYPGKYKVSVNLELGSLSKIASDDPNAPPPIQSHRVVRRDRRARRGKRSGVVEGAGAVISDVGAFERFDLETENPLFDRFNHFDHS